MNKKPKILLALMALGIGGVETHIVELADGLKKSGYEPIVVSNGGVYVKTLEELGVKHRRAPLLNKSVWNMFTAYKKLKQIIIEEEIDIVHAHARIPAFILGFLHRQMHFPFVTTAHWVFRTSFLLKRMSNWGQATLAVSNDIKEYLRREYKLPESQIYLTINGISAERFSDDIDVKPLMEEFSLSEKNRHIVYVSRMDIDRSLVAHQLIHIAEKLLSQGLNIDFIIVGGGNDFENIKQKAESLNQKMKRQVIIVTGPRTDVNRFVALSDLFVGVSRSVLEAMAAAKPVILAGNEGYLGVFESSKLKSAIATNFTCRGEQMPTEDLLYEDITKIIFKTNDQNKEIGEYGKKIVMEQYSIKRMTQDNIALYERFLKHKGTK